MTLDNFYHSEQWKKLIAALRIERTIDGQLICQHCGRPITKAYDCIGHHIIELTEDNVNDFDISLNPENIILIHFRCHNQIHERFEYAKQNVYLVWGSPFGGKLQWVKETAYPDDLIVDMTNIWNAICTGDRPNRLKPITFKIRDALIDSVKIRQGFWRNAFIVGSYPLRSDRERICNILNASEIHIDTSREECLANCSNETQRQLVLDYWATLIP